MQTIPLRNFIIAPLVFVKEYDFDPAFLLDYVYIGDIIYDDNLLTIMSMYAPLEVRGLAFRANSSYLILINRAYLHNPIPILIHELEHIYNDF